MAKVRRPPYEPVHHPEDDTEITTGLSDGTAFFAAFGHAQNNWDNVLVILLDKSGNMAGHVQTLAQPTAQSRFWAIAFTSIRYRGRQPFTLQVFNADDHDETPDYEVVGITFRESLFYGDPAITYPTSANNPMPTSFIAYGTTSRNSVSARMAGNQNYDVDPARLSDGGWFATFSGLVNNNYTLEAYYGSVTQGTGQRTDYKTPINVV